MKKLFCIVVMTALSFAAEQKDDSLFSRLARAAACSDQPALYTAAQNGDWALLKLLLDAKANPNEYLHFKREGRKVSPLSNAVGNRHADAVELLLNQKLNDDQLIDGVLYASEQKQDEIAYSIAVAFPDRSDPIGTMSHLLHTIAPHADPLTMHHLLEITPRARKFVGVLLTKVISEGRISTAHMIIDMHNPKLEVQNPVCALSLAARRGETGLVMKLIKKINDPQHTKKGQALVFALQSGVTDSVRILLDAKADLNYKHYRDPWYLRTPLQICTERLRPDFAHRIMWSAWLDRPNMYKGFTDEDDQKQYVGFMKPKLKQALESSAINPETHGIILSYAIPLPEKLKSHLGKIEDGQIDSENEDSDHEAKDDH